MTKNFRDVLPDDVSLVEFMKSMKDFEEDFVDAMMKGVDFTIKLEVRGNNSNLVHCQVVSNHYRRPEPSKVSKRPQGSQNGVCFGE